MLSATKSLLGNGVFSHSVAAVKEYPFSLRRTLLALAVGLLAIGLLASYNAVFAQGDGPTTEWLNGYSDNIVTVVAAALVFFMQAGFAFLGAGLIRSKNTTNYLTKSFMDFAIASLGFWAFGFAFMLGDTAGGFIGLTGWFPDQRRLCGLDLPDGLCRHRRHHRGRRHGRAHQAAGLPGLQLLRVRADLPHLRALGLGRRLARRHGRPGLCRFRSGARGWRLRCPGRRSRGGSAHGQVHQRAGAGDAGAQHALRGSPAPSSCSSAGLASTSVGATTSASTRSTPCCPAPPARSSRCTSR